MSNSETKRCCSWREHTVSQITSTSAMQPTYKDSANMVLESQYQDAILLFNDKQYDKAIAAFETICEYKDSDGMLNESRYQKGLTLYKSKQFDSSNEIFLKISNYKDSSTLIHKHDYQGAPTKEASCTESGIMTYSCMIDGCTSSYTESTPALGHDYTEKVITPNSCENDGESLFSCSHCNNSYSEVTKAFGHSYSEATCTKPSTCRNCGKTKGSALGHTTTTGVCSRCGANFEKPRTFTTTTSDGYKYVSVTKGQRYRISLTASQSGAKNSLYTGGPEGYYVSAVLSSEKTLLISIGEAYCPSNTLTSSIEWTAISSDIKFGSNVTGMTVTLSVVPL